jgi:TPR repeat protein
MMIWRILPFALLPMLMSLPALAEGDAAAAAQESPAERISDQIFGPRVPTDLAFGAFQRGYFLTALDLALPRAGAGDAAAQTLIAEIYAKGLGVAQNDQRAAGWYQLASKNGDILASFELALLFQNGTGVPKNRALAADLFKKAAEAGYIPAKYNLALLHVEGIYASPSLSTAAELMREAAEDELPEAQYDYGTMLIEGAGVPPDPKEGARYIELAAAQNLVAAQVDYATLLYMGQGVAKDIKGAVSWYARAAEAGNAVAQNRYAKLLAVGEGVPLDLQEAAMWRALSRRQGLNDPSLDRLLVSIPEADLATAEERARFWPSRPPSVQTILEIPTISPPSGDIAAPAAALDTPSPASAASPDPQNP